jgi:DNA polymerase
VYRYAEKENFDVLLFGYAFDDEPVQVVDLASGEKLPAEVEAAISAKTVIKTAFNANFERTCLAKYFNKPMPPEQWQCTQVLALTLGLPQSLEEVGKALGLTQNKQKTSNGAALIRFFSVPQKRKATEVEGSLFKSLKQYRNLPTDHPEKWAQFKAYCAQDVEAERAIREQLIKISSINEFERRLWCIDQKINDYGVEVDQALVRHAIRCDRNYQKRLEAEAFELTKLDNPKSVSQLKAWLFETEGMEVGSLNKDTVPSLLKQTNNTKVQRVLEIRQELAKTSVKKYEAMARSVCRDSRVRGLFQYYGANRSGRWAGRLVQVQNLPQNKLKDLDLARQLLRGGDYEALELLFDSVPDVLSQLIRTAIIAGEGKRFIVADFSAIEARIIAWLAEEEWRMEVFRSHGKIYEASASRMFKVPIEEITKDNPLRQKGKIAELALGYGGSVGALINMGALKMGLVEDELPGLVKTWRAANPKITSLWWEVEEAAMTAIQDGRETSLRYNRLIFSCQSGFLFITLPSGRRMAYVRPRVEKDPRYDKPIITYEGYEQGKWSRIQTYGPKLVENIVQGIARDCLAYAMTRLDAAGYRIVMHVHDEVVLEVPNGQGSLDEVCFIMGQALPWAPGLPLPADGYETYYYRKD